MPKLAFTSQESLKVALVRAHISHACRIAQWVFTSLVPRLHPVEYNYVTKENVQLELDITFQGRDFTVLMEFLMRKRIIIQAPRAQGQKWSGLFRRGVAIGGIVDRVETLEKLVASHENRLNRIESSVSELCAKLNIPDNPPDYPELHAHFNRTKPVIPDDVPT